jgi:hypothetical protein
MMLINHQKKNEFVEDCQIGNVVLTCFITAHACTKRYNLWENDTDSIIYQHDDSQFNPTIINRLGGWTDELSSDHITKYMSGGPKNYAYETQGGKSICKVKGMTLNYRASHIVSPATLGKKVKRERRSPSFSSPLYTKNPPT